jgi:hypothetical protein
LTERFAIEGVVVAAPGSDPIVDARVVVDGWIGDGRHGETRTDAAGRFRIEAPRGVRLLVTAKAPGFVPKIEPVERAVGGPEAPVVLRFRLACGGRVVGVVRHADGSPAAGATVHLAPQRGSEGQTSDVVFQGTSLHVAKGKVRAERPRKTTTDAEGRFEIDGVPFGSRHVAAASASRIGTGPARTNVRTSRDAPETSVELVLPEPAVVSVQVVDEDGAPVEGAQLFLGQSEDGMEDRTDRDGRATFSGVEMAWWSDVHVEAPGFVTTMWFLRDRRQGTIRLPRPVRVTGTVRDDQGAPVLNAHVAARPSFEGIGDVTYPVEVRASSRRDGSFALEGLPPGPIEVQAVAPGYSEIERIDGVAGASPLEIVLPREVRVRARLVPVDGRPPEQVRIVLPAVRDRKGRHSSRPTWARPFWRSEKRAFGDGRIEVSGLPASPIALWFQAGDAPAVQRTVAGGPGEVVDLGDVAVGAVPLEGRIVSREGGPIANAHVVVLSAPDIDPIGDALSARTVSPCIAVTDSDGRFRLDRFPAAGGFARVGAEGYAPAVVAASGSPTIALERGVSVRVRLRPGSESRGRILIRPVLGDVVLEDPIAVESLDRDGSSRVRLANGRYVASLGWGPGDPGDVSFEVTGDRDLEIDVGAP